MRNATIILFSLIGKINILETVTMDINLLTIAISSYKNVVSLKRAIDSIYDQKISGVPQIYVSIDDTENTLAIIDLLRRYPSIRYSVNKPALGMAGNWNHCIEECNTPYVALLHDDDYLFSNYLETAINMIGKLPDADCICFNHYFDVDGVINDHIQRNEIVTVRKLKYLEYWLGGYNYKTVPTCGIVFRRSAFLKHGGYSLTDGYSVDESFMESFIRNGFKSYFINARVAAYSFTSGKNLSSQKDVQRKFILENINYRKRVSSESVSLSILNKLFGRSMTMFQAGQYLHYLMPEFEVKKSDQLVFFFYKVLVHGYHLKLKADFRKI